MTYIPTLFLHLRHKVYLRRYGRPTCAVIFYSLFNLSDPGQAVQILFCIDKARKRSFTEVALNSVLEENAASAINFEWDFNSPTIHVQIIILITFTNSAFDTSVLRLDMLKKLLQYRSITQLSEIEVDEGGVL